MKSDKYKALRALLSGWFHQDFDLVGDSIEDVIAEYKRVTPMAEIQLVVSEIDTFISAFEDRIDGAFLSEFDLEIDPTAFAASVRDFLNQISCQLEFK